MGTKNVESRKSWLRSEYEKVGGDPHGLQIEHFDGDPENALSYKVTRSDGESASVRRMDIDDGNELVAATLRDLAHRHRPPEE